MGRLSVRMMGVGLVLAVLPGCAAMALVGVGTSAAHYLITSIARGSSSTTV